MEEIPNPASSGDEGSGKKQESKILTIVAAVIGAVIGFAVVKALPPKLTIRLFASALAGCACGLIPYFIAKKKQCFKLSKIALGICSLSGALLGIHLAIITCVFFIIIALVSKAKTATTEDDFPEIEL